MSSRNTEVTPVGVKKRRRWLRVLLWTVVVLGLVFYAGGGWYFADQLRADAFEVKPFEREYRATISSINGDMVSIAQGDSADAASSTGESWVWFGTGAMQRCPTWSTRPTPR